MIKKERKTKPVRLFLPESLDLELRTYSKVSDVPLAEIIRCALVKFLESDREWQKIRKEKVGG